MATFKNFMESYVFLTILNIFLYFGQGQSLNLEAFQDLSEINQKWLRHTSYPEFARLLQYPPYSYHSRANDFIFNQFNASELSNKQQESFVWDTSVDHVKPGKCSDDLIQVIENLDSQWALQMLDSDGKLSSGILRGGLIWPGHYRECISTFSPLDDNGHGDFHGQYCVSSWSLNLGEKYSNLSLTVGLCIPDSCSGENIETALKNISHILDRFPVLKKLESYLTLNSIICKSKTKTLDAPSIIYLTVVSIFIFLTVLGSSITLYDNWKFQFLRRQEFLCDNTQVNNYGTLQIQDNLNSAEHNSKNQTNVAIEHEAAHSVKTLTHELGATHTDVIVHSRSPVSAIRRILLCFNVFTNGERILNTENVRGQLLSIHGIRFLSLTWVILGHTYISAVSIIGNRLDVLKDMDTFAFQMLLQAPFSVDSFFLLSGFLLAYLFLKEAAKTNGRISWIYFYIHRLWRLTPAYIIAVFFYMLIFKYLGSGPFWNDNNCDANRSSWWKYVLYINNFIPIKQMCVGWSWYLANDMQFYIISPLFLYPLWKWPVAGFTILGSILLATWTTTGIMSYSYDLIPMFVGVTETQDFTAYEKKMWDSFDLIYDKPYCRIAPYIIGVILGYILYRTADRKNFLTWWQQLLGWIIAAACSLSVVFGLYHVHMSKTLALFYNALCRSSFAIGLAWLIYACETGHGGFITKLLSWKFWIPLSRLTYCTYLIHPMLIHGYYQAYQSSLYFTEFLAVTNFMGFLLMSYGISFVFSLLFESPFMNLEKLVLQSRTRRC